MTYLHSFTKTCDLLSVTARLVLMLLVGAGGFHTCGLKTDGTVARWGYNDDGQSAPPQEGVYLPIILKNH